MSDEHPTVSVKLKPCDETLYHVVVEWPHDVTPEQLYLAMQSATEMARVRLDMWREGTRPQPEVFRYPTNAEREADRVALREQEEQR